MNELEWPKLDLIHHRGFNKGELAYHIAKHTPISRSKSWTEKMYSAYLGTRYGGKTQTAMLFWEDECNRLFPRKQTKLLQSKGKCPRIVRVIVKQSY